ncbi:MAG: TRAP transporter large permease [Thermodesulfobacteriota bacterium]
MIDLSPEWTTVVMFAGILVGILLGYPLAFSLSGVAMIIGFALWGSGMFEMFYLRLFGIITEYVFLAFPLFVFMGIMVERSGVTDRLFGSLYLILGGLRGGLAISTIVLGTILAASVGVIGASVTMMGLIALPAMVQRNYDKSLASGAVCAGGTLGILIPPSIMLVIYGPTANISVGELFMAAFFPGFLLSGLYILYIGIRCALQPQMGPAMPARDRNIPAPKKFFLLGTSLLPPLILILTVLGSIFFGIAAPTEAAAMGAIGAIMLALAYRSLSWKALWDTMFQTMHTTAMALFIAVGASMFTGTFLGMGCGDVLTKLIVNMPFGKWGSFVLIMVIVFVLGMFIDWIGIVLVMVPLVTPIGDSLGFNRIWLAMMIIVNLQMSFMTPPFAYAIFFLKGIIPDEMGISTNTIIRGVIPFIALIAIALGLMVLFPEIILWLPSKMLKY